MAIPDTVFTMDLAKAHLRVFHTEEDALIESQLDAAVQRCEEWTGRAWTERTVIVMISEVTQQAQAINGIMLPLSGGVEVTEFKYRKVGGAAIDTDMPADSYRVVTDIDGTQMVKVDSWPTDADINGDFAKLIYKAAPESEPPKAVVHAAMLYLGDLFENREAQAVGTIIAINESAKALLAPYRVSMGM